MLEYSIDLDNICFKDVLAYMKVIKYIGKGRLREVLYRRSSGGNGYHIQITIHIPSSFEETIKDFESFTLGLRYLFFDCFGRLKTDIARLYLGQTIDRLAIYKDGNFAGEWKVFYSSE